MLSLGTVRPPDSTSKSAFCEIWSGDFTTLLFLLGKDFEEYRYIFKSCLIRFIYTEKG